MQFLQGAKVIAKLLQTWFHVHFGKPAISAACCMQHLHVKLRQLAKRLLVQAEFCDAVGLSVELWKNG